MEHFYQNIQGWFTYPNFYSEVAERFSSKSKIVEIGVWKGTSVSYLGVEFFNRGKHIIIDCIDTFEGTPDDGHLDDPIIKEGRLLEHFIENTKPIKPMINAIKLPSLEACKLYEDESIDFVFIDAAHDYENVKNDINAWYPKVKSGGIISGHDYTWHPPIQKAVHEFFDKEPHKSFRETEGCWVIEKL